MARSIALSARFFCSGGASESTRDSARAPAASSVTKAGQSPLPSMAFRYAVISFFVFCLSIRPCSSMEIADLARQGTGMANKRKRIARLTMCGWLRETRPMAHPTASAQIRLPQATHHQIVAVDHFRPSADAEDCHHVGRATALDLLGILGVLGHEAAANLMGVGPAHDHGIAAGELAINPDHARR